MIFPEQQQTTWILSLPANEAMLFLALPKKDVEAVKTCEEEGRLVLIAGLSIGNHCEVVEWLLKNHLDLGDSIQVLLFYDVCRSGHLELAKYYNSFYGYARISMEISTPLCSRQSTQQWRHSI